MKRTILNDRELVEWLGDEPELLAVADAFVATQTADSLRRTSPRRRWPLAAAVAVAVALLSPWSGGRGGGVIERALAAIGTKPILHAVVAYPSQDAVLSLRTGRTTPIELTVEQWYDATSGRAHFVVRLGGRVVDELLIRPDGSAVTRAGPVPGRRVRGRVDAALVTFVRGYRDALVHGRAQVTTTGTLFNRPVYWLRLATGGRGRGDSEQVAVDRESYRPLLVRQISGGRVVRTYRIARIETVSRADANFERPKPARGAATVDAASVGTSRVVSRATANSVLGGRLLWLGPRLGELRLTTISVQSLQTTYGKGARIPLRRTHGVELLYARDKGEATVRIAEALSPEPAYGWPAWLAGAPPAPASLYLSSAPPFGALLHRNGVYVTISGAVGKEGLLRIAGHLKPPRE